MAYQRHGADMSAIQQMLVAGGGDPYFSNVSLLLHADGVNGSTTFIDNSPSPKTVTANSTAQISTTQWKFGGASGYFNGTFDPTLGQPALTVPNDASFDFGSGDFTVEMFIRLSSLTGLTTISHGLASKRNTTAVFSPFNLEAGYVTGFTRLKGQVSTSGAAWITCQSATNLAINTWYHAALCRSATDLRLFLDGIQQGATQTVSGALITNSNAVSLGAASFSRDYGMNGFMDEVRITKGVARYTANFTPPAAPFPNY